ncbi:MAG TPA: hypothetical protein VIK11_00760 [Tepidiformaceae bacterium]
MATYYEQLNEIADLYFARFAKAVPAKEIMAWAIQEGLYRPTPNLVLQKAEEDLARALREDVFTDPQGRHVRAKYAARIVEDGIQTTLWADHTFASPQHIALSLKQRRTQIVADCHKLKTDVDSFNENDNLGPKLQLSFDFTLDLEELDAADAA